jgi:hypothetical protein
MASAMDRSIPLSVVAALTAVLVTSGQARPGEPAPGAAAAPTASGAQILGNDSYLRAFLAFRTPVVMTKDGQIKTALEPVG